MTVLETSSLITKSHEKNDDNQGQSEYESCSTLAQNALANPIFLLCDPIRTFNDWKQVGRTDVRSFVESYMEVFRIIKKSGSADISVKLYERLVLIPHSEIQRLCSVPYTSEMLEFKQDFRHILSNGEDEREQYSKGKRLELFKAAEAHSTVVPNVPCHNLLSNDERSHIEERVGRLYMNCWGDKFKEVHTILTEKKWFGFDLDDTLHEFRKASTTATNATLQIIASKYDIPMQDLKTEYRKILSQKTSNAFVDGKTSHEYRRDRFSAVLEIFSPNPTSGLMEELLSTYETTITASLELKSGTMSLLHKLKSMGKKIAVITEGPQDAQERTLEALGIIDKVDFLATTNHFKVSKTTGIFEKVLEYMNIDASEMVYVGDNEERDMRPAVELGIYAVHLTEQESTSLDMHPVRINTLNKLEHILLGG